MTLRLHESGINKVIILLICIFSFIQTTSGQDQFAVDSLLAKYRATDNVSERVTLLIKVSDMYEHIDIKKSFEYANMAYEESEKTEEHNPKANALNNLGVVFLRSGAYDKATEMFLQSKKLVQDNEDFMRLVGLELNLGAVRFHLEDYDGALAHFNEALELNSKLLADGNDVYMNQIQIFYINIGSIYMEKGNYDAAIEYFEKALVESVKNNDLVQQGIASNNLGELYLKSGASEKAIRYIRDGLDVRLADNNLLGIASSYDLLTAYYLSVNDIDSAEVANTLAIEYAERVESLNFMEKAYKHQADIYELKGNYKASNEALKQYYETKRKAINESVVEKTTRLQLEYDFKELQKEKSEAHFKQMITLYAILAVVVFLLVIFVLLFNLWKSRAKRVHSEKESLEKDLELKNKELTTNVMYLLKKHELINNISGRLLRLKARMKTENRDAIQRIIFDLQGGAEPEVWEEFELRFQNVHTDFYKKLEKVAPDLTPSELKICAFLKLNMNSKEISALIHQSTKSVEVKRSRIRKKLGITNTDVNLIKFLSEL
ncbi:tetratricopeptide repeat protein [Carboxylicivirga mesophila]|uniref:Tetratricopeptide repeat protein n=1 Tax=Carboxylicivirga mesophila TaxID=1166478 RepID=A0ABS5KEQ5_9BACT|nr:tetratricopeptide repeat protein [Carboxylicivirga mesophila]MBS2213475.1 tetratricopeptide repeat protein [Carboxylicivirga mesophila]